MRKADKLHLLINLFTGLAGAWMLLFLLALLTQQPVRIVEYIHFGLDFGDFQQAARDWLGGANPYQRDRFVTPPFSILAFAPFAGLSLHAGAALFFVLNLALVLVCTRFLLRDAGVDEMTGRIVFGCLLLSEPFLMLIERGNIDGLVYAAIAGALLAWNRQRLSGSLIGLAAALKLYPLIMLPALWACGGKKRVLYVVAFVAVTGLAMHEYAASFVINQMTRAASLRLDENLSIFGLTVPIVARLPASSTVLKALYVAIIAATFAAGAWACFAERRMELANSTAAQQKFWAATFLAFALNVPTLVYLYSGVVVVIILILWLDDQVEIPRPEACVLVVAAFLILFPARAYHLTLQDAKTIVYWLNVLPPVGSGLLLLLFGWLHLPKALRSILVRQPG